jgi:hypothetical protein
MTVARNGLYQACYKSKMMPDRRLYKIRAHVLITLVGVQYLGAHRVVPVELRPVPGLNPAPVTEK